MRLSKLIHAHCFSISFRHIWRPHPKAKFIAAAFYFFQIFHAHVNFACTVRHRKKSAVTDIRLFLSEFLKPAAWTLPRPGSTTATPGRSSFIGV